MLSFVIDEKTQHNNLLIILRVFGSTFPIQTSESGSAAQLHIRIWDQFLHDADSQGPTHSLSPKAKGVSDPQLT